MAEVPELRLVPNCCGGLKVSVANERPIYASCLLTRINSNDHILEEHMQC
ncbi:hypothetical protein T11_3214 [Trichinella zimbabwensis]|uniref:Uncharacterized protein n=1 Tax=Trichinella zimbabwensis TaxID=268475 RepID=A0A0V1HA65_9BILA|nr:hypothetical protein T11_3214 [Trichinella zimbabwensis]